MSITCNKLISDDDIKSLSYDDLLKYTMTINKLITKIDHDFRHYNLHISDRNNFTILCDICNSFAHLSNGIFEDRCLKCCGNSKYNYFDGYSCMSYSSGCWAFICNDCKDNYKENYERYICENCQLDNTEDVKESSSDDDLESKLESELETESELSNDDSSDNSDY